MAMPVIPTAAEIKARIIADIESKIGQSTPTMPKAFNRVIAGAFAGVFVLLYHAILWVYKQIFPDTADWAALVLLGKLVGISPTRANAAIITANVFGTNTETVNNGTLFKSDSGVIYSVTTGGTIAGGFALCTLTAQTSGEVGNIADGATLNIVTADPVLTGTATVVSTTTEGDDAESEESFRARVVNRYKRRYTGGSPADYEGWGLEAPHFIWVSPYAGDEPGEVFVYGEVDNQTDGIPTAGQLVTLLEYIEKDPDTGLESRRPIGDVVTCYPITRKSFDFEISIKNGTAQIKSDVEDALAEYLMDLEPYNEGVSVEANDAVSDTGASSAANDVARSGGATITGLTVRETDTQTLVSFYILYGGEKAKLGTVTFTDVS